MNHVTQLCRLTTIIETQPCFFSSAQFSVIKTLAWIWLYAIPLAKRGKTNTRELKCGIYCIDSHWYLRHPCSPCSSMTCPFPRAPDISTAGLDSSLHLARRFCSLKGGKWAQKKVQPRSVGVLARWGTTLYKIRSQPPIFQWCLWMKNNCSPSASTRMKSLAIVVVDLQHTLKGVQGGD